MLNEDHEDESNDNEPGPSNQETDKITELETVESDDSYSYNYSPIPNDLNLDNSSDED